MEKRLLGPEDMSGNTQPSILPPHDPCRRRSPLRNSVQSQALGARARADELADS